MTDMFLAAQYSYDSTLLAVGAELARAAAFVESVPDPVPVQSPHPQHSAGHETAGGGGSITNGHSDAWWHGVAICEQGGRNDPYYGYFSFMDGSAGGKSWDEQVAMGNALLARAGREIGPWAAVCVAAGYRESPSG